VTTDRWNHNMHCGALALRALPDGCRTVLDIGCGEGWLAQDLSKRAQQVTAIDIDAPTLELARHQAAADNIDYVLGDFLDQPFEPGSFDAVVSVAALHHMDPAAALRRMAELLRPGGRLIVVGLARSRTPWDLAYDLAGLVVTQRHKRTKGQWESAAPTVWPPALSHGEIRRLARQILPGVAYHRYILFRYSLSWAKPH
jgi:2-polyprenyl-3-methyl-5-hydroxy-6-metoxy-1,4-benzoquinol methylase